MRFETEKDLRRYLERDCRFVMTDREWQDVHNAADLVKDLALDRADLRSVQAHVRRLPRFIATWRAETDRIRRLIGVTNGPDDHAMALFAFRQLEALSTGVLPDQELGLKSDDLSRSLGRILLACVAAQRVADSRDLPLFQVLFAILANESGEPYSVQDGDVGHSDMPELMENAVAFGYSVAFGDDLRQVRPSADFRLVKAVLRIVRQERSRITASSHKERWQARYEAYHQQYAKDVGRSFETSKTPAMAFAKAFRDAQRRVLELVGPWKRLEKNSIGRCRRHVTAIVGFG